MYIINIHFMYGPPKRSTDPSDWISQYWILFSFLILDVLILPILDDRIFSIHIGVVQGFETEPTIGGGAVRRS